MNLQKQKMTNPAIKLNMSSKWKMANCLSSHLCSNHVHEQVDDTVGVAPFVVVPGHNLEEALLAWQVVLQGGLGVIDGGVHIVDEVRGHQLLIRVGEDTLHVGFCGRLEQLVDLLDGGILLSGEGE